MARQEDRLLVDLLEANHEHRTVNFAQDGRPDLDHVVGPDREEPPIERGVVKLAECDAVRDDWVSFINSVRDDVRRVEQFLMPQQAQCAALLTPEPRRTMGRTRAGKSVMIGG